MYLEKAETFLRGKKVKKTNRESHKNELWKNKSRSPMGVPEVGEESGSGKDARGDLKKG